MLGGDEKFAGEGGFGGAAIEGFAGGEVGQIRVIVLLGNVRENEVACGGIEAVGIGEKLTYSVIRKMAGARENALLDDPRIGTNLEHIEIVIGLEDHAIGAAEMHFDHFGEVAEIGTDGHFASVAAEGKTDGIGGIVGNGESVDVDVANRKVLAGLDGLDTLETLLESVGKDAAQSIQGGFGDVERRRFPKAENLGKTVAMIGMLVSDEDGVEAIEVTVDSGKAGESFAFAKASVDEDARAFCFEQRQIP